MRNTLPLKAAALLSSLLLAAWYLHFRATGNAWLDTRAAEGATTGVPAASAPATKPTTILPSSKSGAVFTPAKPALPPPSTGLSRADAVRLRTDLTPMTNHDVMMSSSKSLVIFDSRDATSQPAQSKNPVPTIPSADALRLQNDHPPLLTERGVLMSSSKSASIFTPPSKTATTQPPSTAAAPAPAPAPQKGAKP